MSEDRFTEGRTDDLVELHALCARYMAYTSQFVEDCWLDVFTEDVVYSAFGTPYPLDKFPALLAAAPRGQFIGNMPVVTFDGRRSADGWVLTLADLEELLTSEYHIDQYKMRSEQRVLVKYGELNVDTHWKVLETIDDFIRDQLTDY